MLLNVISVIVLNLFTLTKSEEAECLRFSKLCTNSLFFTQMDFWRISARRSKVEKLQNSRMHRIMKVNQDALQMLEFNKHK